MSSNNIAYYDFIIVGAGPGGLQMAYCLQKENFSYIVLEKESSPGGFFKTFPRHRKLISINKIFTGTDNGETNLRWDWNSLLCDDEDFLFRNYNQDYFPSADALVEYLKGFAEHYDLNVRYGAAVRDIRKDDSFLVADASGNKFRARALIVATGRRESVIPDIPGIDLAERYADVSIDPNDFRNQRVLIIGKGNSGFETAENLTESAAVIHMLSPNPIRLAWRTHYVGDVRAVNNNLLDTYQLKSQNTILDAVIKSITKRADNKLSVEFVYTHAEGQHWEVVVDRVITCAGFKMDYSLFNDESCRPETSHNGRYPRVTSEWESTNVPGVYFVGTLMHGRDYRKTFSGFIHGFRYNIQCLCRIFLCKYRGSELVYRTIGQDAGSVLNELIRRVNTASSLFQQPGFLADVLLLNEDKENCRYYDDLPLDYTFDCLLFKNKRYITLTLEYGHLSEMSDPFNIYRYPAQGEKSVFIHPVIRYFADNEMVSECHIPEDLENQWSKDFYTSPCKEYLKGVIG